MRTKFLSFIADIVIKHPFRVILVSLILSIASILGSLTFLQMNTDQDDLVSERIAYHKRYKDYLREFGDLEYLYVAVETNGNLSKAKDFVRDLAGRLEKIPDIKEVTYQVNNPKLEKSFLLYLPKDQIEAIGDYFPKMNRIGNVTDVFRMMNAEISSFSKQPTTNDQRRVFEMGFRFIDNLLEGLIGAAKDDRPYTPFLQQAFFASERAYDEEGFLLSDNGKLLFIMIMPEKNYKTLAVIDEPLRKIRAAIGEARKEFPGIKAGLTGRPVLSADEMRVSDTDMTWATIAALIISTLIFVAYFRRPTRPAMAAVALTLGIIQTFGITTLVIGHLNILSIVFAVVLVGAGIEFGLQIVSRYREELATHKDVRLAIETCITETGKGNMTACATTAAAFFSMCLTNFLALKELGAIAGIGILLCLVNMFTVLPAMMYIGDRNKRPEDLRTTIKINLKPFRWFYRRPRAVLASAAFLTIVLAVGLFKISFNHNLLDMQAKGLESVEYEKKIIEESTQSTWYVPFIVYTHEDIKVLADRLKKLPSVGKIETIDDVVPPDQKEKIRTIKRIAGPLLYSSPVAASRDNTLLAKELLDLKSHLFALTEMAFSSGEIEAVSELEKLSKKVDELSQLLTGHETRVAAYNDAFIKDLREHIELLKGGFSPVPIKISDMPEAIQKRYISPYTKRLSLYAYPRKDIWDPKNMEEFIKEIRSVDPYVTGTPVEVYESSRLLEESFRKAALYSFIAIILIVAVDFRKFKLSILTLSPLIMGILWLLETMGLFGIRFNLANFFGIPILVGIGIDNAVQITHRFLKDPRKEAVASFMTRSTGTAVLLTSLTTLVSFGTLIFARHQGISSLGLIMTLGTLTCFIGSMIMLPCLLILFAKEEKHLPQ